MRSFIVHIYETIIPRVGRTQARVTIVTKMGDLALI